MLHQSRNTGTVQSLFKLLDKLEECAENHKAITIKGVIYILLYLAEAQLSWLATGQDHYGQLKLKVKSGATNILVNQIKTPPLTFALCTLKKT